MADCYLGSYLGQGSIRKVNNGFIVETCNGTFVAKTLKAAAKILVDNFEAKPIRRD